MQLRSKRLSYKSANAGIVYEKTYYTQKDGLCKMRVRNDEVGDDIMDHGTRSFSEDNGKTWHENRPCMRSEQRPGGVLRLLEATGFVDPVNGRLLTLVNEGVFPNDNSHDANAENYLTYNVSADGGKTLQVDERLVQRGPYTPEHPIEPVRVGKNAFSTASENAILRAPSGHLVVVTNFTPLGEDGHYKDTGVWTYTHVQVLLGHWQEDGRVEWELGQEIDIGAGSTRGAIEPTISLLPDGRILMVMRGGNDGRPDLPSYKWYCVSEDEGRSWTQPQPWYQDNGTPFYSPGSMSQLFTHSNGKCYWVGNMTDFNPLGNCPRHPLFIGEVDTDTLGLKEQTLLEIDGLRDGDDPSLALSNFYAYEDRVSHEIIVHCTRMFSPDTGWHGDSYEYRIEI